MNTDLAVSDDAVALERDPVQYMAVVLNRAKSWLAEAETIDSVRNTKAIAVGYESVIREKELAFDAQLSATEIVRRCERRIGELVRVGQEDGTVTRQGLSLRRPGQHLVALHGAEPRRMHEAMGIAPNDSVARTQTVALADASSAEFEQAIADAREEGNLSRANVVRKVKGTAPAAPERRKPAVPSLDTQRGRQIAAAHARRFTDLVSGLAGYADGIQSLDIALIRGAMEPTELNQWTKSLTESLGALRRFRSDLQESQN